MIDRNVDKLAEQVRETLSSQDWIPDVVRPRGRPPTPAALTPSSAYDRVQDWVSRHKLLTGFVVLTTGVILYRGYKKGKHSRKTRRGKRAKNGARLEVLVIAGDPKLPLTRSLSLDMERRGFIVYVACNNLDDEAMVQNMSRPDIRPLGIDIIDVSIVHQGMKALPRSHCMLTTPPASQRWRLHRTLCTLSPDTARCRPGRKAKPPHPEIRHSHPVSQLPDVTNSDDSAVQFRRYLQHTPSSPHSHHPSLPSPLDRQARLLFRCRETGPQSPCLHALHHVVNKPALPRPRGNSLLRPIGLHRGPYR